MAIEQVKTISELERFDELIDSYALAISSGSTTGSGTLLQIANYLKTYLQDVSKKIQTIDESADNYPSSIAVKNYVEGYSQALSSLVQNLDSPSATTYPSTQAVVNESNRIIDIMDNIKVSPNYSNIIDISGNFTASSDGVLYVQVLQGTKYCKGTINGIAIIDTATQGTANITEMTDAYLLRKNDTVIWTRIGWNNCWFVPFN